MIIFKKKYILNSYIIINEMIANITKKNYNLIKNMRKLNNILNTIAYLV